MQQNSLAQRSNTEETTRVPLLTVQCEFNRTRRTLKQSVTSLVWN
jgi:hypothetical protein